MSLVSVAPTEQLPALVDRAMGALALAKDSAEVLEARDMARVAYDAAKSAGRIARAKEAHDTVLAQVYRAQADALLIESRAKMRLAEEYDAAQERGEVRKAGNSSKPEELVSADDILRPLRQHPPAAYDKGATGDGRGDDPARRQNGKSKRQQESRE